jgi:tetratricopeptide (TPR) repeat protein
MRTVPGISAVVPDTASVPRCDAWLPLLSAMRVCGTDLASIRDAVPYVTVEPERQRHMAALIGNPPGVKVGVIWAGNPNHENDRNRSIDGARLGAVLVGPGQRLFSLQKGAAPPFEAVDLAPKLHDFADTAAAISQLDVIVAVDTAVAHLAGALYKPIIVLVPFAADWRWLTEREDSPWYPTVRLLRQDRRGDWTPVLDRLLPTLHSAATATSAQPRICPMSDRTSFVELQREAKTAYRSGNLARAIELQREVVLRAPDEGQQRPIHHLLLGLYQYSCNDAAAAIDTLSCAKALWPSDSEIAENLGVVFNVASRYDDAIRELDRARSLGRESSNLLDALCHASGRTGNVELATRYGRESLELKNQQALAARVPEPLPAGLPPAFDRTDPRRNVIAYSVWGANPRYLVPLLESLRLLPHLFPGWTMRIYTDSSVPVDALSQIRKAGADIRLVSGANEPFYAKLLWRFAVANDSSISRFIIRDADSLLTTKERVAVDTWLASDKYFHTMRDFFTHTDLLLAGMWGGVAGVLPDLQQMWRSYQSPTMLTRSADQRFLGEMVWPTVAQSCLIHDSVFTGCLGSLPFSPYGELPRGRHIGQNAFPFFRRNSGN